MSCVVLNITCANAVEAEKITKVLLENKLVACVNRVSTVHSVYWWQNAIESADEVLLIAKTRKSLVGKVIEEVKKNHSYDVPEVIAMSIVEGNPDYIRWIETVTTA